MALFLEGRRIVPLLMLSIGAYLHLLYPIYVLVPCVLVVLYEAHPVGRRQPLLRLAAAVLPILPFLAWTFARGTPMTAEWLALLRLRSSHHSFPSFFGDTLAAGAFLMALGTLTLSRLPREKRAVLAWFFVGFALLFVFGTVFTEFIPMKAVLQFQPHRCWRFLMLSLHAPAPPGMAAAAGTLFWLGPDAYARKRGKWETGSWREVQDWARLHTPKDAIFVTPPEEAGFRVFSERTVVGEWKDGTQQYFDETFATEWAARMEALGRGGYVKMTDDQLSQIARRQPHCGGPCGPDWPSRLARD